MKRIFASVICLLVVATIYSCSKSSSTGTNPAPVTKTKAEYLSAHPWKYDELFNNYSQSSATLVYKRGKPNNYFNLDNDKYTYNSNGTFTTALAAPPYSTAGTWQIINSDTQLKIQVTGGGIYTGNIITLNDSSYVFYDAGSNSYGKMIPW